MQIKILILEDNPLASQHLKKIITDQKMYVTGVASTSEEAFQSFYQEKPDLLIVDINLKFGDDGIEIVEKIRVEDNLPVIYLTADTDEATVKRALATKPSSFITKPFNEKDVEIAIDLAMNNYYKELNENATAKNDSFIFLKSGNRYEKVHFEKIRYLKANGSYTDFITSEKNYTLSDNLNHMLERIQNPSFLRVHRSFAVNINSISELDNDYIFIGETRIPISRSYRESVMKILNRI